MATAEELITRAEFYVDWAAALRLLHDDKTANEKLRMAAGFYMDAGEHGMAQKCKMLIVTE